MSEENDDLKQPVEVLHEGRFMRLMRRGRWEYGERTNSPGAVLIAALTDAGDVLLIEQLRVPLQARCIELPAGIAGDLPGQWDEAFEVAARRELLEETGYEAAEWTLVASAAANPGMDAEKLHFFVARGLTRVGEGGGDETENITVHEVALDQIHVWLDARRAEGAMVAQNVYAGLYWLTQTGLP
ncbi:MAG: ADP-ribose pyrophosphatase [Myxococcota bacterium]|jgi:ADP-ribose pyrophosphatase